MNTIIGVFLMCNNPVSIDKSDLIKILGLISYDRVNSECIKYNNGKYIYGFTIAGLNKIPGYDSAMAELIEYCKVQGYNKDFKKGVVPVDIASKDNAVMVVIKEQEV